MKYSEGFKYQLVESVQFKTDFRSKKDIVTKFCTLLKDGVLILEEGFAWDGPSGPVVDRKTNMKASALHDGLYRLMRKGLLNYKLWNEADCEFAKQLKKDGAWPITIWVDMKGLKIANGLAAHPKNISKIYQV